MSIVSDKIQNLFTCSEIAFSILSFSSVTELLNTFQYINKTAHQLILKDGYLLRTCLMNALGMAPDQHLHYTGNPEEEEKEPRSEEPNKRPHNLLNHTQITSLLHLAKYCIKNAHRAPAIQMFSFRSTIGCDQPPLFRHKFEIYNLGVGDFSLGFCSEEPGPGCFTLIPYVYDNRRFQNQIDDFQYIADFVYSWKDSLEAIKYLNKFITKDLPKLRASKGMA